MFRSKESLLKQVKEDITTEYYSVITEMSYEAMKRNGGALNAYE